MEPIISPWVFYFMGVAEAVQFLFGAFGIIALILMLIVDLSFLASEGEVFKKTLSIVMYPVLLIMITIAALIPSKETMMQMLVASQVTPNNVSAVVDLGKKLKDETKEDVIDIIKEFK